MPSPTPHNATTSKIPSPPAPDPPTSPSHVKSPPLPVVHRTFPDPSADHPPTQQHTSPPQPNSLQPSSNSRPPPNTATTTPRPSSNPRPPQSRRNTSNRASRVGRPPNINENCLMRRLECVMAVESGRMSMLSACQQYDISARTFYRWLRDKHRLIELTGFSEEDFRTNPPWAPPPPPPPPPSSHPQQPDDNHMHLVHDPQPHAEPHDNLPRLSQPPPVVRKPSSMNATVAAVQTAPNGREMPVSYMGMKRRFPKGSDARAQYTTQEERYRGGSGGGGGASQAVYYARRSFTKMPSNKNMASQEDAVGIERNVGRTSSRMKRQQEWEQDPEPRFHEEERAFGGMYEESRSDSPAEPYKRRKVIREQVLSGDEAVEVQQEDERGDTMMDSPGHDMEYTNGSGYGEKLRSHVGGRDVSQQRMVQRSAGHVQTGGRTAVDGSVSDFGKHRIEIMMGRRKVSIAWYEGVRTEDIKAAISRRFALLPGTQWALVDKNLDEIIISAGVPSGRYTLTVFS